MHVAPKRIPDVEYFARRDSKGIFIIDFNVNLDRDCTCRAGSFRSSVSSWDRDIRPLHRILGESFGCHHHRLNRQSGSQVEVVIQ